MATSIFFPFPKMFPIISKPKLNYKIQLSCLGALNLVKCKILSFWLGVKTCAVGTH